jgi:hypothetical protein
MSISKSDDLVKRLRNRIEALEEQLGAARAFIQHVADGDSKDYTDNYQQAEAILALIDHPAPAPTPSLDDLAVAELECAVDEILRKCATTQKELDSQICAAAAITAITKTAGGNK